MITGCGKPFALHGIRTFCVSFSVTVGEGFEMKRGNSKKKRCVTIVLESKMKQSEKALKSQMNIVKNNLKKNNNDN